MLLFREVITMNKPSIRSDAPLNVNGYTDIFWLLKNVLSAPRSHSLLMDKSGGHLLPPVTQLLQPISFLHLQANEVVNEIDERFPSDSMGCLFSTILTSAGEPSFKQQIFISREGNWKICCLFSRGTWICRFILQHRLFVTNTSLSRSM